ncbi:hypothetical protein Tco_0928440 [Tanacetum coccineum]
MRNSGTWASIVRSCLELEHVSIDLENLMERKVLSGNQTRFWTDCWIKNHGPLKNRFPILFALETSKDCFVADRWVHEDGFWHAKWSWRRHPSGRASGELDHLVSLINGLVLDSNLEDKWFWSLDNSGAFSNWRNKILHAPSDPEADAIRHEDIFPSVQRLSLLWAYNRSCKKLFSWENWIKNPGELAS